MVCLVPYLPVYMIYLGLSATQIGIVNGMVPFTRIITGTLIGMVIDRYSKHKVRNRLLFAFPIFASFLFFFLSFFFFFFFVGKDLDPINHSYIWLVTKIGMIKWSGWKWVKAYEKVWRYKNSPPYAKMATTTDSPLNFLDVNFLLGLCFMLVSIQHPENKCWHHCQINILLMKDPVKFMYTSIHSKTHIPLVTF